MSLRAFFTVACRALLRYASYAQNTPAPAAHPEDVQPRAEALLKKGRHVSDIRSSNAPRFRLSATFSLVGTGLETVQGTYTELWVSKSEWRQETVTGDSIHLEIGGAGKHWILDKTEYFPEKAKPAAAVMQMFPASSTKLDFESVVDQEDLDLFTACALTKPGTRHERFAVFYKKGAERSWKRSPPNCEAVTYSEGVFLHREKDNSCIYGAFRKFGAFWFPREVACFRGEGQDHRS